MCRLHTARCSRLIIFPFLLLLENHFVPFYTFVHCVRSRTCVCVLMRALTRLDDSTTRWRRIHGKRAATATAAGRYTLSHTHTPFTCSVPQFANNVPVFVSLHRCVRHIFKRRINQGDRVRMCLYNNFCSECARAFAAEKLSALLVRCKICQKQSTEMEMCCVLCARRTILANHLWQTPIASTSSSSRTFSICHR